MPDLKNPEEVDEETKLLMDAHARLVQQLQLSVDDHWSLAQPSPFRFVPSVVTDSTSTTLE
jgi:hypothetical protein